MGEPLPQFDRPPVVETVISVQFRPLVAFSTPLAGWYWKQFLGAEWESCVSAPPLADQFENFEDETIWAKPGLQIQLSSRPGPERLQITSESDDRMIQVQSTRFVYNWRKREDRYPSYRKLRPEFDAELLRFREFAHKAGLGGLDLNQWEMTYVNHIEKGTLWQSPADWATVLPGYYAPLQGVKGSHVESFAGEWHLEIEPQRGRLHIALQHGHAGLPSGEELMVLQLTARGPIDEKAGLDMDCGLELAHETIVRSFTAMTHAQAHRHWRRRT